MTRDDLLGMVGMTFMLRSARHVCIAAADDALLLLEHSVQGKPYQYIVAHHPSFYGGELVWANGNYFPFALYRDRDSDMSAALQDAVLCLNNTCLFAAMADDDNGIRCVGVFTTKDAAAQALEKLINNDVFIRSVLEHDPGGRISLEEFKSLHDEFDLEDNYWIDEHRPNQITNEV